jgi:hypothetical protein
MQVPEARDGLGTKQSGQVLLFLANLKEFGDGFSIFLAEANGPRIVWVLCTSGGQGLKKDD